MSFQENGPFPPFAVYSAQPGLSEKNDENNIKIIFNAVGVWSPERKVFRLITKH